MLKRVPHLSGLIKKQTNTHLFSCCPFGLAGMGNYTSYSFSSWTFNTLCLGPWVIFESSLFIWKLGSNILHLYSHPVGQLLVTSNHKGLENGVHVPSSLLRELITTQWGVCCGRGMNKVCTNGGFSGALNGEGGGVILKRGGSTPP